MFRYQSGRVIALGRVMLVTLFLLAVWLDRSGPDSAVFATYSALWLYAVSAIAIAAMTWRNWWLDARLSIPMHGVDMAVFTAIVFSTNGSTSPFFLFFVLPLLAAAIRWSWRETALTAAALIVLYLVAGLLIAGRSSFELERFVIRSGHLLILSSLLIWFGINQRLSRISLPADVAEEPLSAQENPLHRALGTVIQACGARGGALMVAPVGDDACDGLTVNDGDQRPFSLDRPMTGWAGHSAFLFDLGSDRAISRQPEGRFRFARASALIDRVDAQRLGASEGLIAKVNTGTQQGWLMLWGIPGLSSDYIELGQELGRIAGTIIDRHALLQAIDAGAAARTRLALARDIHDSIVQFLAGAAFRVEAIRRSAGPNGKVTAELDELKRLLVEEQGEIRGFLLALRRDRELAFADTIAELRALAERLGQQWSVDCKVTGGGGEGSVPIRLQIDLQQMLREAVANAVRHGGADRIDVALALEDNQLLMEVSDNGSGFGAVDDGPQPRSLKERVDRAHGQIRLTSRSGATRIRISLPLEGAFV